MCLEIRYANAAITKPTPIVDERRVRENIARMAEKAARAGVRFRPHFKTHQSAAIGEWFRDGGVEAITVSSVTMASYFAEHNWKDITIALPVNLREADAIAELAVKIDLGLLFDCVEAVTAIESALSAAKKRGDSLAGRPPHDGVVRAGIKIDAGYGRVGVRWDRSEEILALARAISSCRWLRFEGILTHSGHSYRQEDIAGVRQVHEESLARMRAVREMLRTRVRQDASAMKRSEPLFERCLISIGDTPTCSTMESFPSADEIRPGNFVFYDVMQWRLGVCGPADLGMALACPVIGVYPQRGVIALYGGSAHLSSERVMVRAPEDGEETIVFGYLANFAGGEALGVPDARLPVVNLTQEHGIVLAPSDACAHVNVGDLVLVYPAHSCLTAAMHREYVTTIGERVRRM